MQEESTCHRATKPMPHATEPVAWGSPTPEPASLGSWSPRALGPWVRRHEAHARRHESAAPLPAPGRRHHGNSGPARPTPNSTKTLRREDREGNRERGKERGRAREKETAMDGQRDKDRERLRKSLLRKPETPPRVLTSDSSCWGFWKPLWA